MNYIKKISTFLLSIFIIMSNTKCDKYNGKVFEYQDKNLFVIFYSPSCDPCKNAIKLLQNKKVSFKGYNIDNIKGGKDKLLYCLKSQKNITKFDETHETKPIIFYKGKFIGGFSDLILFLK